VLATIAVARERRLDDVAMFLADRFGRKLVADIKATHEIEEQRPDRDPLGRDRRDHRLCPQRPHSDRRIELEREAGKVMQRAA